MSMILLDLLATCSKVEGNGKDDSRFGGNLPFSREVSVITMCMIRA